MNKVASNFGQVDGLMDRLNLVANGVQTAIDSLRTTSTQLMTTFDGATAQAYSPYHHRLNQKIQDVQDKLARARAAGQAVLGTGGDLHNTDRAQSARFQY
ncbi:WXG100 family type VII secretion target [Nocardia sputorum]|uniref:WXG100 family type VII secretion target n=1 Tax=Nocardia sputorum TaxID=2984338 RepID=UPI00249196CD|nr:WXG100 family type VII secretion target [Nocardia sputorum]